MLQKRGLTDVICVFGEYHDESTTRFEYIAVDLLQQGHSSGICNKSISPMFSFSVVTSESAIIVSLFSFSAVSM